MEVVVRLPVPLSSAAAQANIPTNTDPPLPNPVMNVERGYGVCLGIEPPSTEYNIREHPPAQAGLTKALCVIVRVLLRGPRPAAPLAQTLGPLGPRREKVVIYWQNPGPARLCPCAHRSTISTV